MHLPIVDKSIWQLVQRQGQSALWGGPRGMGVAQSTLASIRSASNPYYLSEPARSPLGTFPRSRDRPAGSRPGPPRRARRQLWAAWYDMSPKALLRTNARRWRVVGAPFLNEGRWQC